jgi:hypothetical protein
MAIKEFPARLTVPALTTKEMEAPLSSKFEIDQIKTDLLEPNSQEVIESVWPMVEGAFERYTADRRGNDINGERIRLTKDQYDVPEKSKVVVAYGNNNSLLGTFRIVQADSRPEIQPPIDAMRLITGHNWPEANQVSFGEFSRFAVQSHLNREEQQAVLRSLYQTAMEHARSQGFDQNVYVILGNHVRRFVNKSGIKTEIYPGTAPNYDCPEAEAVFRQWPRYWQPDRFYPTAEPPQLYRYLPEIRSI